MKKETKQHFHSKYKHPTYVQRSFSKKHERKNRRKVGFTTETEMMVVCVSVTLHLETSPSEPDTVMNVGHLTTENFAPRVSTQNVSGPLDKLGQLGNIIPPF